MIENGKTGLMYGRMDSVKKFLDESKKNYEIQAEAIAKVAIPSDLLELQEKLAPMIFSIADLIEPAVKQIQSTMKQFDELQKRLAKLSPKRASTLKKMSSHGWAVGGNEAFDMVDELEGMSAKRINAFLMNYYTEDNYRRTFEEMDLLIDILDHGYKSQVIMLKSLLLENIHNYKLAIPVLFPILEYVFERELGMLDKNKTISFKKICNAKKKVEDKNKEDFWLTIFVSTYGVLQDDFYDGRNNSEGFEKGINGVKYSRHSVLHGRFDPNRLSVKKLIQLIVLITSVQLIAPVESMFVS